MKLRVTDPGLKASLIIHLIEKIDGGDLDKLLDSGISAESLDKLRALDIPNLIRLIHLGCPEVSFGIEDNISHGMETLKRQNEETEDIVYFIQHGATQFMLAHLFRFNAELIQHYRKLLAQESRPGRASMPDARKCEAIQTYWHKLEHVKCLTSNETLRKKVRLLHQEFSDVPIDELYAAINEFEKVL